MTVMRVRERGHPNAEISFDHGKEYSVTVSDAFSEQDEARLEWYFEQWLRFPFLNTARAREVADSITTYGETLFRALFLEDPEIYAQYKQIDIDSLRIEIVGSPEFHALHWEALKDPKLPQPLSLRAPMVRKSVAPHAMEASGQASPTINLLIVTARPDGEKDVGYRTISRPLVENLTRAQVPVRIDILRPGTFKALVKHLEDTKDRRGTGYYHIIHFDVHGALLRYEQLRQAGNGDRFIYQSRYGRQDIDPYEGYKAFMFLEREAPGSADPKSEERADPVEASELANLLIHHQVPVAVLNACQSGKQLGTEENETSLGSRLMQAGIQTVLAMGYSITVSAAERLMQVLYKQLFNGEALSSAIRRARLELYHQKGRRAYYNQVVDLEDWLLPVVYENQDEPLALRAFESEEQAAWYEHKAAQYQPPKTTYGFVGRDLDVLQIEKRLLKHNILLVRGMGGAGKTTLLQHLGYWWQTTRFIDKVFEFGFDVKAWGHQQILDEIARRLLGDEYSKSFRSLSESAQQSMLVERFAGRRHLLILDNLESITGSHLAILNTLPPEERTALHEFLMALVGGKTLVLLGSRGGEAWLAEKTFDTNVYELPGLDPEAASDLAEQVLERHGATQYREDEALQKLLKLLDGYPLPVEVVLTNLAQQTPAEVLAGLQAGDVALDSGDSHDKTQSILRCIEYSHSNLSPEAQELLGCLAPFTAVINTQLFPNYLEKLKQQPALAHLPIERWDEVLQEAINWGLLSPHTEFSALLRPQPIFPYFLRNRLQSEERGEVRAAVETAFRECYDEYAGSLGSLMQAKDAQKKQMGQILTRFEYENLDTALNLALAAQVSTLKPYAALSLFLDAIHDEARGLALGRKVLAQLEKIPARELSGRLGLELVGVIDNIARRQLALKQSKAAETAYQKALALLLDNKSLDADDTKKLSASIYHQLGRVAQEQRQWGQAEEYYQKALEIQIEFKDRHSQASTYHQLGRVAQEQRQWGQAEEYYQKALKIYVEFKDRYEQVSTYHQLGRVAQEQRQWGQAEEYYQKALEIKIEFKDRYEQASTYHQLGRVAQEQRQWGQAEECYLKDLEISIEFEDKEGSLITLRSLARLWQASGKTSVPAGIGHVLGETQEKAEELLRSLDKKE